MTVCAVCGLPFGKRQKLHEIGHGEIVHSGCRAPAKTGKRWFPKFDVERFERPPGDAVREVQASPGAAR